ncbi:MAG TPA: CHASE3 domain-containing protein [Terriglobales bacterium]|nr:CHASE3 domain-containing protein [Terriglobales bacterium]
MSFSLRGVAWTAFAVAVVLLVGSSIFLLRATHALFDSEALVAHTREVQTVLEDLSSRLFQITNSRRGFVITRDESFLNDYHAAQAQIPADLDRLRGLIGDNAYRRHELDVLQSDIDTQLNVISSSLEAAQRRTSGQQSGIQATRESGLIDTRVQAELQNISGEQEQLLSKRQLATHSNYQRTLRLIFASFIIALMLLVAEMFLLSYEFTRHRQTQYAARQSQEIVDAFFSSSTVGFGILDSQFRYTRVNSVLPQMAGLSPEDFLGKSVLETFGEPGGRDAEAVLRELCDTGKPVLDREFSIEVPGEPGERGYWLVNYFPIRADRGAVTQIGVTAVEVTARRNAEEALRKLSGRLLGIQDQERRRIARELHDSLGQYLAGMKIAIDMLSSRSGERDPLLTECAEILDRAIVETRTLSHLLHPPLLDEAGFASAASWFVAGFSQRSGIPVSLDMPPDLPRLPEAIEIALFRVLQESLTNVHRHSHTNSAEISVEADAEQITIEVRDHGRGMPREILEQIEGEGSRLGVGLAGMRERIHEIGGTLEVASGPHGTMLRAKVPLISDGPVTMRENPEWIA